MKKKENMFSTEAVKRQKEQEQMEKKLTNTNDSTRKVPMNITLPADYKNRLQEYAKAKHLSASVLIQMWIDEKCV